MPPPRSLEPRVSCWRAAAQRGMQEGCDGDGDAVCIPVVLSTCSLSAATDTEGKDLLSPDGFFVLNHVQLRKRLLPKH